MTQLPSIKLFVATPLYGGMCFSNYLTGMIELFTLCTTYKIPATFYGVVNSSLLTTARDECASVFLSSDFTHLLFIDADIGFTGKDALSLLQVCATDKEEKYDVLAGSYPQKHISWDLVKQATLEGLAENDADCLRKYAGHCHSSTDSYSWTTPIETDLAHAGFMLIKRSVLEAFTVAYPEKQYITPSNEQRYAFFECTIDPLTKQYSVEDHKFCEQIRKTGKRLWIAPWLDLNHQGMYTFEGCLDHAITIEKSLKKISPTLSTPKSSNKDRLRS